MTTQHSIQKKPDRRPTIGFFLDWLEGGYQLQILLGAVDYGKKHHINLYGIEGGCIHSKREHETTRNKLFELVGPHVVDGLIILSASIGHFATSEQIDEFCRQYQDLPVVSIAHEVEGCTSVLLDNATGLRELVAHLVQVHHYSRFAFISGPKNNHDSLIRHQVVKETLAEYDIRLDESLVIAGEFTRNSGAEAVKTLLDQRNGTFEVVVAANDEMALGALTELRSRGMKIPEEVAVVGFDDWEAGAHSFPPLTTIGYSLYEQGKLAMELLLDKIAGKKVPSTVFYPTRLILRESCGCFSQATLKGATGEIIRSDENFATAFFKNKEKMVAEIVEHNKVLLNEKNNRDFSLWVGEMLDALYAQVCDLKRDEFLRSFYRIIQKISPFENVLQWQNLISETRRKVLPYITDSNVLNQVEDSFHQVRVMIAEKALEREKSTYQENLQKTMLLNGLSEELLSTFTKPKLFQILSQTLPKLGITTAYIFENAGNRGAKKNKHKFKIRMAYNKDGPITIDKNRAYSYQLVPEVILEDQQHHAILIMMLDFSKKRFGTVAVEVDLRNDNIYGPLRRIIQSSLFGILLAKQLQEQEKSLVEQQEHLKNLSLAKKTMDGFIKTILLTVEVRDPYTAGHQNRVADLARAIAAEMGLSQEICEAVRMAGILHDLGKIAIPAEILNKPGRLDKIEFAIIQDHPTIANNILKNIDFPWPIANIILQHHERLNGTGYPYGLKGDGIMLEARILAVADVIEAMASHRPYRPALGLGAALHEISANRDILYDERVVDACLNLFNSKGYQLNDS